MKKTNIGKIGGPFKYLIVISSANQPHKWYSNRSFSMPGDPLLTDTQNTGREGLQDHLGVNSTDSFWVLSHWEILFRAPHS
jgi:hypothetical protein